jgi:hypothetical protein
MICRVLSIDSICLLSVLYSVKCYDDKANAKLESNVTRRGPSHHRLSGTR